MIVNVLVSRMRCRLGFFDQLRFCVFQPLFGGCEMARDAFRDAFAVAWIDDRQDAGEERIAMIAAVERRILFVAYTMRGARIRIISARKAEPHERRRYHDENQA